MRLLLLLILAGIGAYYTVPTREAHEAQARATVEAFRPNGEAGGINLDSVVGYVRGMMVGQGRYETFYLASKYSLDMPGAAFVECYGAFTIVRCSVVEPGAQEP